MSCKNELANYAWVSWQRCKLTAICVEETVKHDRVLQDSHSEGQIDQPEARATDGASRNTLQIQFRDWRAS